MAQKLKQKKKSIAVVSLDRVRVNLDIPSPLFQRLTQFVDEGWARSRNALILESVQKYLDHLAEAQIDDEFARMAEDQEYASQSLHMAEEFAASDWEALQTRIRK